MVDTSVRGTFCTPCVVATKMSDPSERHRTRHQLLVGLGDHQRSLSEENSLTSPQSMDTSPAYVVLITSFFPSMLTIAPVKWSPFFSDTCSACVAITLQIIDTNTNDQNRFTTGYLVSLSRRVMWPRACAGPVLRLFSKLCATRLRVARLNRFLLLRGDERRLQEISENPVSRPHRSASPSGDKIRHHLITADGQVADRP